MRSRAGGQPHAGRIPRLGGYPGLRGYPALHADAPGPGHSVRHALRKWLLLLLALAILLLVSGVAAAQGRDRAGPAFPGLFRKLNPTVVTVSAARIVGESQLAASLDDEDETFMAFMREQLRVGPGQYLDAVLGSGFVVGEDGYIVTAAHVLEDSVSVIVELLDHRVLAARIVGLDRDVDVALLKVDAGRLATASFGKAAGLEVGETVFSIGAPFGLEHSMNSGLVSGRDRLVIPEAGTGMLQTEVAVNPGGSGSPLFSLRGEVVGMNTLIFSYSGGYNGVTLAIPAEVVEQTVARLKSGQPRGTYRIGARFRDLSPLLARSMGVASGAGAIVVSTDPAGAAAAAGLRIGDVVLELDGVVVTDALGLLAALNLRGAKPQRMLKVMRERSPRMLQLALPPRVEGERTSRAGQESFPSRTSREPFKSNMGVNPCLVLPAAYCGVSVQPVSKRRS